MKKIQKRRHPSRFHPASKLSAWKTDVAGIDIGSREMFVCGPPDENEQREMRVFATTTVGIQECVAWLQQQKVVSVAMESTGVYWIPVLEIMENRGLEVVLVDTRPLSRVPGRKTDAEDCQWLQTLHSHGLLQGVYRPGEQIGEVRTIVRQKAVLVRQQADLLRRMQKCLDQMNVRIHQAVTQTKGATGMAMLRAIVGGERDPRKLAQLRDQGCRNSESKMVELLTGHWRSDHLFNLGQLLRQYDFLSGQIGAYEQEIQQRLQKMTPAERQDMTAPPLANREKGKTMKKRDQESKRQTLYRMIGADLTAIDGIGVETAEVVMAEYGPDLSKFPTEGEFVKHIGLAPHRPVSGGKVLKKRRQEKATRTAEALRNAAAALKASHSALGAYYRRMARRKDSAIAVFATARKLAQAIFRILRYGQAYVDIGQAEYERRYEAANLRALQTRAKQSGYALVKLEPVTV
jgi:transposase